MKKIYHYHPESGVLNGVADADESPLEPGQYLIPAYATEIPPPIVADGQLQLAVFDGANWVVRDVVPPPPPPPPSVEQIRSALRAELVNACQAAITGGYLSAALGAPHTYPSALLDQQNMAASVLDSLLGKPAEWTTPFWCADASGVWSRRPHTVSQIQQAGGDGKAWVVAQQDKLAVLMTALGAAQSPEEIAAVFW